MKELKQFIAEGLSTRRVNEKLSSDKVRELFKSFTHSNLTGVKALKSLYKWDKIQDDDLEDMSVEEAYKLARRRDSDALIVWCQSVGGGGEIRYQINAVSMGASMLSSTRERGRLSEKFKSVKRAADYSQKAILIKDSSKFSTSELRVARSKAKENALALKKLWEISHENEQRRKQLLKELKDKKNTQDVQAYIDQATDIYTRVVPELSKQLGELPLGVMSMSVIKTITTKMQAVTTLYAAVISDCENQMNYPNTSTLAELKDRLKKLQDFEKTILDLVNDLYTEAEPK